MTGNAMRMSCVVVCFCSLTLEPVVGWKSISWVLIMATFVRQMESFGCNMPRNSKKQTPDSRATLPFRASHPCRHARHGMKWCRRRRGVWVEISGTVVSAATWPDVRHRHDSTRTTAHRWACWFPASRQETGSGR
ncbi:predicted protein [Chaetomium globosum CBS 148.51]|uniref:Secreted protein n=1 Tax=Chaetomium globosum (strain ATCC 6205 / CBS 148.51 / DSM 1962 / NBRC 6347 / NRRL 1970) TaxID=306901 RepID=Q2H3W2_CHAGB|nr:uncharacterized protein CHGG_06653 [Chaetomium globosum CBS 148.51]EAQ90034.1 predicted protein [Chaetomium globosum CBS 148.51]